MEEMTSHAASSPGSGICIPGKYKLAKSINFDAYLAELGVGFVLRKLASTAIPIVDIATDGEEWTITTTTPFKVTELKFKLGVPFSEVTIDGRKCESTITKEGDNMLVQEQLCSRKKYGLIREFTANGEMILTLTAGSVTAKRIYKKVLT